MRGQIWYLEQTEVCKSLKSGKAPDFTGLSYEHFKHAGQSVYVVLACRFNLIVTTEAIPDVFKKGITIPIFKGGDKDPLNVYSYRGITIQNVICKVYESILVNRSSAIIKDLVGISANQAAIIHTLISLAAENYLS